MDAFEAHARHVNRLNDEEVQRVLGLSDEELEGARRIAAERGFNDLTEFLRAVVQER